MSGFVTLTEDLIRRGGTKGIGFTGKQVAILGEVMSKGWIERLVGKRVSVSVYNRFVRANKQVRLGNADIEDLPVEESATDMDYLGMQAELHTLRLALTKIAMMGDGHSCPYGCDAPWIAKQALGFK